MKAYFENRLKEKDDAIDNLTKALAMARPGLLHAVTPVEVTYGEIDDYIRMKYNIRYFCDYVMKNVFQLETRRYQYEWLDSFTTYKTTVVNGFRQSGKSLMADIMAAYWILFKLNTVNVLMDSNYGLLSESRKTVEKIILHFVEQGYIKTIRNNRNVIELENGAKLLYHPATAFKPAIHGFAPDLIICNDFAFWDNAEEFIMSTLPTISGRGNYKFVVMSCPNGTNEFYKIANVPAEGNHPGWNVITTPITGNVPNYKEKVQRYLVDLELPFVRAEYFCEFLAPDDRGVPIQLNGDTFYIK